jgi:hypothetical protein
LRSRPPRTKVTAKTEASEMDKDRAVSSTIVRYWGRYYESVSAGIYVPN